MNIYELYGRLMEERQSEHAAHLRTLELLRQVKRGEIALERVLVKQDGTGWRVLPEGQKEDGPELTADEVQESLQSLVAARNGAAG